MKPRYRAWDKEENRWINIASLVFDEEGELWYLSPVMDDFNPVYYENELGKTWEIMQSTGLKDKNGVDIFEGDIVKILGSDLEESFATVVFAEGAFCVDHKNLGVEFEFLYFIDSSMDVIGNIYENPELLEQADEN